MSTKSDFDAVWYTNADFEVDDSHMTKCGHFLKFKTADGCHLKSVLLAIIQQAIVRFQ